MSIRSISAWLPGLLLLALFQGCSNTPAPDATATTNLGEGESGPVTVSLDNPIHLPAPNDGNRPDIDAPPVEAPTEGSPEWIVREIAKIRVLSFPQLNQEQLKELSAEDREQKIREHMEKMTQLQKDRNQQIVGLATEILAKTAKLPEKEQIFTVGARHLLDSRYQLAVMGDTESADALFEAANLFYQRNPASEAAATAAMVLVNYTHHNAMRFGQQEPKWVEEFARQAQLFATRFPKEEVKALPMLVAAGQTCEMHGNTEEALACFKLVQSKFSESPFAEQTVGILRRLELPGRKLQLGGPTLDGNFVSIDDYIAKNDSPGKAVLVVFWSSNTEPFVEQLPKLQALTKKYEKYLSVVGVCLDAEETAVDKFLEKNELHWPQIFHSELDQRGWNAPLAMYYGLTSVPAYWLVDPTGVVVDIQFDPTSKEPQMKEMLVKHFRKGGTTATIKPASGERQ